MRQAQRFTRFGGQPTANDQRNTAACANFIQQYIGLQFEIRQQFAGFMIADFAFIRVDVNHIAHIQVGNVHLDWQRTRIFHRVEEDRRDFAAQHQAAAALVRHVRNIVTHKPQHRVGGGFTGRAGTHNVANVGQRIAFLLQGFDLLDRANAAWLIWLNAFAGVFQHRQGVQRDIGA